MPTPSDATPGPCPLQYSSDVNGDPEALLKATQECIDDHGNMVRASGLTMPVATLGSHPWLRDSLADAGVDEPGNAQPNGTHGIPIRRVITGRD